MGRERRRKRIVVWPVYIDAASSRGMDRKISLEKAVRKSHYRGGGDPEG